MINLCFCDEGKQFSLYQLYQKRRLISFQWNVLLLTNKPVLIMNANCINHTKNEYIT